jgi:hypothetical protein
VEDAACAARNREKREKNYKYHSEKGWVGKYLFWGRRSDDLETLRYHYSLIMEDWNEDNQIFVDSTFLNPDGSIKSQEEIEKIRKGLIEKNQKFFSESKNQYLIPEGIAAEDAPYYFTDVKTLTDKYAYKKQELRKQNLEFYMGMDPYLAQDASLDFQLSTELKILRSKYTTRIFGTEKLTKEEYENYLKDRNLVEEYYRIQTQLYEVKWNWLKSKSSKSTDRTTSYRESTAIVQDNTFVYVGYKDAFTSLREQETKNYFKGLDGLKADAQTAISYVDKKYGVSSTEVEKKSMVPEIEVEDEDETFGIKNKTWHKLIGLGMVASFIIPGLNAAVISLGAIGATTTLGGLIGFGLGMVDAGLYLTEENYAAAGFSALLSLLGIKAPWNFVEKGFVMATEVVAGTARLTVNGLAKVLGIDASKAASIVAQVADDGLKLIDEAVAKVKSIIDDVTKTDSEFLVTQSKSTGITRVRQVRTSRPTIDASGSGISTKSNATWRRAYFEETFYTTYLASRNGLVKMSSNLLSHIPELVGGIAVIEGSHKVYDEIIYKAFDEGTLCDVIENRLNRGDGACQIYKMAFGVEEGNEQEEELLKKAIIDFNWRPGMLIPQGYETESTKKIRLENEIYSKTEELLSGEQPSIVTNDLRSVERKKLPETLIKTVYVYVKEKLPQENTDEWAELVQIETENIVLDMKSFIQKMKDDTEKEIEKLKKELETKKIDPEEDLEKSDFYGDEYMYNDLIDKYGKKSLYNFKSTSSIIQK